MPSLHGRIDHVHRSPEARRQAFIERLPRLRRDDQVARIANHQGTKLLTTRPLRRHATVAPRVLACVTSVPVTVAYATTLVVVVVTLLAFGPDAQKSVVGELSTNLDNLTRGRLDSLVGSAFIEDDGRIYLWLPGLVCLLAVGELVWRRTRLILAFALGHVGATLIVAIWLAGAIAVGSLPTSIAHASDVGISYGAAGVLGALTAAIPARWRAAWIGWWLGVALIKASGGHFTPVGHTVALILGIGLSFWLGPPARWTPTRLVLLAVGAAFGYVMITGHSPVAPAVAGFAGVLVALIVQMGFTGTTSSPLPEPRPAHAG